MSANREDSDIICFVCTANICRSPFGEYLLRKRLDELGNNDYQVVSAGTRANSGQPTTPTIISIGQEFGVDMTPHRSQPVTRELLDSCRFVLAMEHGHVEDMVGRWSSIEHRTYLLRNFARGGNRTRDIIDPYGLSADFLRQVYDDIADAVDGFAAKALTNES